MPVPAQLVDQIKQFLAKAEDWEELETPIAGVFVVKPKSQKGESSSALLEIRPVDEQGKPTGRSKIFLRSKDTLLRLQEALANEKLVPLMETIEHINSTVETKKGDTGKTKRLDF